MLLAWELEVLKDWDEEIAGCWVMMSLIYWQ